MGQYPDQSRGGYGIPVEELVPRWMDVLVVGKRTTGCTLMRTLWRMIMLYISGKEYWGTRIAFLITLVLALGSIKAATECDLDLGL